eukprot:g7746.t1
MKRKAPAISKVPGESTPRECVDVEKQHETQKKQKGDELPSTNKANPDDNLKKRKKERKEIIPKSVADLEKMPKKYLGKYCKKYIKAMLERWETELLSRPAEVKNSAHGRAATRQFKECKTNLKQFFKGCKSDSVHIDVIGGVSKIVMFLQEREYVKAHDQYMLMAIGNAPWPIGVTAVGIHDRTGRERIGSNKIAHIMDDEGTRKYLNAVKRLLTYVQKSFPTDPSKMVLT